MLTCVWNTGEAWDLINSLYVCEVSCVCRASMVTIIVENSFQHAIPVPKLCSDILKQYLFIADPGVQAAYLSVRIHEFFMCLC